MVGILRDGQAGNGANAVQSSQEAQSMSRWVTKVAFPCVQDAEVVQHGASKTISQQ